MKLRGLSWYGLASMVGILFVSPLVLGALNSFKTPTDAVKIPPSLLPGRFTIANYRSLQIDEFGVGRFIVNSSIITTATVTGTVVIAVLAGYGFARYPFRGGKYVYLLMLGAIMVPLQVIIVPLYTILNRVHLTNSLLGLALVMVTYQLPFAVFVMQNSFSVVPREFWEAVAVDGAGSLRALRVGLPLALPGVITAGLFAFFAAWNEFFTVLILLSDEQKFTLPVMLATLLTGTLGDIRWGTLNASVVITALPCVVVYMILQKHFVEGIVSGMGR